jgi:hypothetical protein
MLKTAINSPMEKIFLVTWLPWLLMKNILGAMVTRVTHEKYFSQKGYSLL